MGQMGIHLKYFLPMFCAYGAKSNPKNPSIRKYNILIAFPSKQIVFVP
jgi:hypothetical protein